MGSKLNPPGVGDCLVSRHANERCVFAAQQDTRWAGIYQQTVVVWD